MRESVRSGQMGEAKIPGRARCGRRLLAVSVKRMSTVPRDVGSPGRFRPSYHLDQKKFSYERGNDLYNTIPSHSSAAAFLPCAFKLSDPLLELRHPDMIFLQHGSPRLIFKPPGTPSGLRKSAPESYLSFDAGHWCFSQSQLCPQLAADAIHGLNLPLIRRGL